MKFIQFDSDVHYTTTIVDFKRNIRYHIVNENTVNYYVMCGKGGIHAFSKIGSEAAYTVTETVSTSIVARCRTSEDKSFTQFKYYNIYINDRFEAYVVSDKNIVYLLFNTHNLFEFERNDFKVKCIREHDALGAVLHKEYDVYVECDGYLAIDNIRGESRLLENWPEHFKITAMKKRIVFLEDYPKCNFYKGQSFSLLHEADDGYLFQLDENTQSSINKTDFRVKIIDAPRTVGELNRLADILFAGTDVINPEHYKQGGIECIEAIKAATGEGYKGYLQGNVMKYIWRFEHKNGVEDLQKAKWYLGKLIDELSK